MSQWYARLGRIPPNLLQVASVGPLQQVGGDRAQAIVPFVYPLASLLFRVAPGIQTQLAAAHNAYSADACRVKSQNSTSFWYTHHH